MFRTRTRLFMESLEGRLAPATFTVTNANNSGAGSLRQAVINANANSGADLIDFSSYFNVPRTITLSSEISITGAVTIDGTSATNVTISGNQSARIFNTAAAPAGAAIGLMDLTLKAGVNGASGGAVVAIDEALTVTRCVFSANTAYDGGAVYVAGGTLTALDTVFTKNVATLNGGGAIYVGPGGLATLTRCDISENTAVFGGGIVVYGSLNLENSTLSGNVAIGSTGYGYYPGFGGGAYVVGTATVVNSTISANIAGNSGGIHCASTLTILNSTITGNVAKYSFGGGLVSGSISIESSIVANNAAQTSGADISSGTVNAKTSAILDRYGIVTFNDQGGNRPAGENPRLGNLQNNGGPTKTHLLLPGSPCLNVGSNPVGLTTDQRGAGFARVLAGTADMGAAEGVDVVPTATIISGPPTIVASGGSNYDVVIRYDDDIGIDLTKIDLSDITVTGPGYAVPQAPTLRSIVGAGTAVTVTYTFPAPGGAFDFADDGSYAIAMNANQVADIDLPTQHYVAAGLVGAFFVAIPGTMTVDEPSDIDDGNTTKGHVSLREAVRLANAAIGTVDTITFDPSVFNAPMTLKLAYGPFAISDPMNIVGPGSDMLTLDADGKSRLFNINLVGGNSTATISGLTLTNGLATHGGAIFANTSLSLSKVVISNCVANSGEGGGVFVNSDLTAADCMFVANTAIESNGGGIFVGGVTTLSRCTLSDNQAFRGGALAINGPLTLDASTLSGNSAIGFYGYYGGYYPGYGGGIFIVGNGTVNPMTIRNSTISANHAGAGGGIDFRVFNSGQRLVMQNCTITGNTAKFGGGGIANLVNNSATIALESCIVGKNLSPIGPDVNTMGIVDAKTSSVLTRTGIAVFNDLGGNRPAGEDPLLGPLQNNGGPTFTHALLPGSPVVQRGSNPAGLNSDQRGIGFNRVVGVKPDMGAFESMETPPVATLVSTPAIISMAGGTSYAVAVLFEDEIGIDPATIDLNDITVTGPGYALPQAPVALSISGAGKSVTVTYTLPAPGGAFDIGDNGIHTVNLIANQVSDLDAPMHHFVVAESLGTFRVAIPFALVVDEASDIDDGNTTKGHLSLREALRLTNTIASSTDTITFDPTVFNSPVTIKLGANYSIADPLVVVGPGANLLTLDAGGMNRLFTINAGAGNAVSLAGLTLTNGAASSGGAIHNTTTLNLSDVAITNSRASDPYSALGGGIFSTGPLVVKSSSFVNNKTGTTDYYNPGTSSGGAIYATNGLVLENCTVSGNVAAGNYYYTYFGIYYSPGSGGGVAAAGSATIRNSTISGNSTNVGIGGGINADELLLQNSTVTANVASNGGGIVSSKTTIESSIVAKNLGSYALDINATTVSAKNSSIFSLVGITTFNNLGGNRPVGEDPKLGPLTDNGGPTKTHRLLPGSPCIDVGSNPNNLTTDQRGFGFPRVLNGIADMGAVEEVGPTATLISPTTVTVAGGKSYSVAVRYDDDTGIDLASIDVNDIRVTGPGYVAAQIPTTFAVAGSGKSVTVTYTLPAPGGAFDYTDYGVYTVALAPNQVQDIDMPVLNFAPPGSFGTFNVAIAFTLTVDEASDIDDGNTSKGHLSLREAVRITNNLAGTADTITFDPLTFGSPSTIKLIGGEFAISDPLVLVGPGAALLTLDADAKSRHFNNYRLNAYNTATISGLTLVNGAIYGNGGAIHSIGDLTLANVVISDCLANNANGGGVYVSAGSLTLRDSTIRNNIATKYGGGYGSGGGIAVSTGAAMIERSSILDNQTNGGGGGIVVFGTASSLQISDSTIAGNSSQSPGGGIWSQAGGQGSFIRNSTISGNTAPSDRGGGLSIGVYDGQPFAIANTTITANSAPNAAGGIYVSGGTISLNSTIVAGNTANTGADMFFTSSTSVAGNNNLIGVGNSGKFTLSGTGNKTGSKANPLEAKLGPLTFNVGPTKTHAPLAGSPVIDNGNNAANLDHDQRGTGFVRVYNGKADIGAFETQPIAAPSIVGKTITINGGAIQRSRVTTLKIDFDQPVTLPANPADAFQLKRQSDNSVVALTAGVTSDSATHVTLTFAGAGSESGSLQDGLYTLTVYAAKVSNANGQLDGDGNGTAGGDFVLIGNSSTNKLFRLFGDGDGNGTVNTLDFALFRSVFGTGPSIFDFNNDGLTNATDFAQFRARFGIMI